MNELPTPEMSTSSGIPPFIERGHEKWSWGNIGSKAMTVAKLTLVVPFDVAKMAKDVVFGEERESFAQRVATLGNGMLGLGCAAASVLTGFEAYAHSSSNPLLTAIYAGSSAIFVASGIGFIHLAAEDGLGVVYDAAEVLLMDIDDTRRDVGDILNGYFP